MIPAPHFPLHMISLQAPSKFHGNRLILVFSFQCGVFQILHDDSWSGRCKSFANAMWRAFIYMIEHSYVSSAGTLLLVLLSFSFIPTKLSWKRRAVIGILHISAHIAAAIILMMLLEMAIDICIRNHLLATSGTLIDFDGIIY